MAFVIGAAIPRADSGPCLCNCTCSQPYRCCANNGVESCQPTGDIEGTQVFPCWWS